MYLSEQILGSTAVETLKKRVSDAVLTIGSDTFTRHQLAKVACYNFAAATRLTHIFAAMAVKDTRDVFNRIQPGSLATASGLGVISLATLGAAFEAKRLGNLMDYIHKHQAESTPITTFSTMKHHALDHDVAKEKTARRHRRQQRRDTAHKIRTTRFQRSHAAKTTGLSVS